MQRYLIFTSEKEANVDLQLINETLGCPDGKGTESWDVVQKAYNKDIWFFTCPNDMSGKTIVTDISELQAPRNLDLL